MHTLKIGLDTQMNYASSFYSLLLLSLVPQITVRSISVLQKCPNREFFDPNGNCLSAYKIKCRPEYMKFSIFTDYLSEQNLNTTMVQFNSPCTVQTEVKLDATTGLNKIVYRIPLGNDVCGTTSEIDEINWVYKNALRMATSDYKVVVNGQKWFKLTFFDQE